MDSLPLHPVMNLFDINGFVLYTKNVTRGQESNQIVN